MNEGVVGQPWGSWDCAAMFAVDIVDGGGLGHLGPSWPRPTDSSPQAARSSSSSTVEGAGRRRPLTLLSLKASIRVVGVAEGRVVI